MPVKNWNHPLFSAFFAVWAVAATLAFTIRPETPACVISLDRMNVLYLGMDNPAQILVRGVPEEALHIQTSDNLTIQKGSGLAYTIRGSQPGTGSITVSGGNLQPVTFRYEVRRIPDPVFCLGAQRQPSVISSGQFRAQTGVVGILENIGICGSCETVSYKVTQLRQGQVRAEATNTGARYTPTVQRIIDDAQPGDLYFFHESRVRCPGDEAARALNDLNFLIK